MIVGNIMLLFFTSSWIIIHFGRNPVSGGSPPRDNIIIRISTVMIGVLFHVNESDNVVVADVKFNSINVDKVIVM